MISFPCWCKSQPNFTPPPFQEREWKPKEDLRHLVEKLISRCAKVDHGIFDDGIAILRGLANALVSIAPASARALQRSEIPPSGYPHASDASAESLEQYREFFKKTSEEAKTL